MPLKKNSKSSKSSKPSHSHSRGHSRPHSGSNSSRSSSFRRGKPSKPQLATYDDDEPDPFKGNRYDPEAKKNYQYELPDQFEDEDIDEDGAFNEDDEEKYGELFHNRKITKKTGKPGKKGKQTQESESEEEQNLSEDEEEDQDEDGDGMIALSDLLDEKPDKAANKNRKKKQEEEEEEEQEEVEFDDDDEDEEDDDDEEEDDEDDDEDDEDDEDDSDVSEDGVTNSKLRSMINALEASIHKEKDADQSKSQQKKKGAKRPLERSEGQDEAEFAISSSSAGAGGLSLEELMAPLQGRDPGAGGDDDDDEPAAPVLSKSALSSLRSKLKIMEHDTAAAALATPLPETEQEAITRRLAYEMSKEELEKWEPLIRELEKRPIQTFPLEDPGRAAESSASLQVKFKPDKENSFENEINSLIKEYDLNPEQYSKRESLQLADRHYTEEEIKAKQAQLAKMRSLLFYQELKMRRVNKIKSKTYRKLRKRAKERELSKQQDEGGMLIGEDEEEAEERARKAETDRARERMTLQHSNSSKWMKRQLRLQRGSGAAESTREAIEEQMRIQQDLRKKIQNAGKGKDKKTDTGAVFDSSDDSDDSDDSVDSDEEAALEKALKALESVDSKDSMVQAQKEKSTLFSMKFMQRAAERQQSEYQAMKKAAEDELAQGQRGEMDEEDGEGQKAASEEVVLKGRKKIDPKLIHKQEKENPSQAIKAKGKGKTESLLPNSFQIPSVGLAKGVKSRVAGTIDIDPEGKINQEFQVELEKEKEMDKGNEKQTNQTGKKGKGKNQTNVNAKESQKGKQEKKVAVSDADSAASMFEVEPIDDDEPSILTSNPWTVDDSTAANPRKALREEDKQDRNKKRVKFADDPTADEKAAPLKEAQLDSKKRIKAAGKAGQAPAMEFDDDQEALVAEAFAMAGDGEEEFENEKNALIESELPVYEAKTNELPGWGSWAGDGKMGPRDGPSKRQMQKRKQRQEEFEEQKKKIMLSRADAKLSNVIISEKVDKKATKYMVQRLPYPFTSVKQYEMALAQPVGAEWNTITQFQQAVKPKVITRPGEIIAPMKLKESKQKRKEEANKRIPVGGKFGSF